MIDASAMQELELVVRSHHIGSPRLYPSQRVKSRYFYTRNNYFVFHAGMQTLYGSDSPRPPLQKSVGERLPIRHWAPMLSTGNYFLYGGSTSIRSPEAAGPTYLPLRPLRPATPPHARPTYLSNWLIGPLGLPCKWMTQLRPKTLKKYEMLQYQFM